MSPDHPVASFLSTRTRLQTDFLRSRPRAEAPLAGRNGRTEAAIRERQVTNDEALAFVGSDYGSSQARSTA